jgi:ABC-2 type transport system ATP-binding protein
MSNAIETRDLTKTFEEVKAVDALNWSVKEGSIHALLGPNGAGKTTTMKMLFGMTHPSSGEIDVLSLNAVRDTLAIRSRAALIAEDKMLYESMKVDQFLRFYSSFFPNWSETAAIQLLQRWKLSENARIRTLSKGQRAKLLLIAALSRKPQMLVLDEPTDGLDPATIEEVLVVLSQWISKGQRTVVTATHRLEEVERISDHVSIIHQGKLLLSSDLESLRQNWKTIEITNEIPLETIQKWVEVAGTTRNAWSIRIITSSSPGVVLEKLQQFQSQIAGVHDMNLREIYLAALRHEGADYDFMENLV